MIDDLTPEQRAMLAGQIQLCQMLGLYGRSWSRTRPTGDGITEDAGELEPIDVAIYIRRAKQPSLIIAAPGTQISAPKHNAYDFEAHDLAAGDTIRSNADPAIAFKLGQPDRRAGFTVWPLEPTT